MYRRTLPESVRHRVKALRDEGKTWEQVVAVLHRDRIRNGRGDVAWSVSTVRKLARRGTGPRARVQVGSVPATVAGSFDQGKQAVDLPPLACDWSDRGCTERFRAETGRSRHHEQHRAKEREDAKAAAWARHGQERYDRMMGRR